MYYRRPHLVFSRPGEPPPNSSMEINQEVPRKKNKKKANKLFMSGISIIVIGMLIVQEHNADENAVSFLRSISADGGG